MIWRDDLITHGGLSIRRQSTVEDVANSQRRERRRKRMSRVLRACGSGTTISRQTTTITRNRISFYTQRRIHLAVRPLLSHSDVVVFTNRLLVFFYFNFFSYSHATDAADFSYSPSIDRSFFFFFLFRMGRQSIDRWRLCFELEKCHQRLRNDQRNQRNNTKMKGLEDGKIVCVMRGEWVDGIRHLDMKITSESTATVAPRVEEEEEGKKGKLWFFFSCVVVKKEEGGTCFCTLGRVRCVCVYLLCLERTGGGRVVGWTKAVGNTTTSTRHSPRLALQCCELIHPAAAEQSSGAVWAERTLNTHALPFSFPQIISFLPPFCLFIIKSPFHQLRQFAPLFLSFFVCGWIVICFCNQIWG